MNIVTDQYGYFRIIPGSYPEESVARKSAQEFVASVLYDALDAPLVPVDSTLNACVSFYYQELDERGRDRSAEAAEDEAAKLQLSAFEEKDSASRPPVRPSSKFEPVQEKNRNPGQAASSSSGPDPVVIVPEPADQDPRPEASEQAVGIAIAESVPTDPDHFSPVSENTEIPPPTEGTSEDEEATPLI